MARSVDAMIDDILRREGGFVNHKSDRGGPTNYGVTIKTLSRYLGRAATVDEVKGLSIDLAREIYETAYYREPRIDALPDRVQPFLFDAAINHGPRRAIKFLQSVCLASGFDPNGVDGIAGPGTRAAAVAADQAMGDWLVAALAEERRMFYRLIVERDPSQRVFLAGWMNRVAEFDTDSESMVA
ncbi:MAG: glycoside hydrolase family 108 protein [Geminicoccaceae bacterium]